MDVTACKVQGSMAHVQSSLSAMLFPIGNRLAGWALSPKSVGWVASAVLHVAAALAAWAMCAATMPTEGPELLGNTIQVQRMATWLPPEPSSPVVEIAPAEARVLVMPNQVRIAERTYFPASTDVSQPTPSELAMADRLMRLPAAGAVRRSTVDSSGESSRVPTLLSRVSRQVKPPGIPTAKAEFSTSAPREESVGTSHQTLPRLLDNRPPTYPAQAVADRLEGTVLLRIHVTSEGDVAKLDVLLSSRHPILDAAAVRAVRSWRFAPARRGGRTVAAIVRLPVRFALD